MTDRKGLYLFFAFVCLFSDMGYGQQLRLWYRQPAAIWEECVPLGNGRLGAMPDGGIVRENIVLNDITLWSGAPQDADKPGAAAYLPEIRKLLFEGKNAEAEALINKVFICKGAGSGSGSGADVPYGSYQVLGNLHLQYDYGVDTSLVKARRYVRSLSLDSALAGCRYTVNGVTYSREYFTSFAGDVILIRLSADRPGKISFTLSLDRPERYAASVRDDELDMAGQLNNGVDGKGMRYLARVRIRADGGKLIAADSTLQVRQADAAVIYISAGTDFRGAPFEQRTRSLLEAAMNKPYAAERADHIRAYQQLFQRASLSLGNRDSVAAALPTDERLAAFAQDPSDNGLPVLYFQYGRYLLISSTRPGLLPPNLQGLWANTVQTPWNGDYHLDVNIEMNHWPLELTNLPMLNEPFYSLVKGLVKPGEKTAKVYYNGQGWVAHVITNVWGYTSPGESASWGATNSGSGWLCEVLWHHYAFTLDTAYLRKIYPILKGSAAFYLSTMVEDPRNGWLVTAPSNSPENAFRLPNGKVAHVCAAPTIDNQIIRELFTHVTHAADVLGTDAAFSRQLEEAGRRLPPNRIGKDGRLMEWLQEYQEVEPHHRHVSHLWGLYPGNEITVYGTPKLADAARASLEARGDAGTGWSLAFKMNLWARLQDGNHAFRLLKDLLNPTVKTGYNMVNGGGTYPNLFDAHPPFQIDGNFGGSAGIAEMLLQSHAGYISFLPALPDRWSTGSFEGLCVRGGGVVSATWKDHRISRATLQSNTGHAFSIRLPEGVRHCSIRVDGKAVNVQPHNDLIRINMKKGQKATLVFK